MTIPELFQYVNTTGVLGLLLAFIAGTYYRKLMWRKDHEDYIAMLKEGFANLEKQYLSKIDDLKKQLSDIIKRSDEQLADAVKRGDEWQDMALQQKRTVDKSLDVVAVSAEKSTK